MPSVTIILRRLIVRRLAPCYQSACYIQIRTPIYTGLRQELSETLIPLCPLRRQSLQRGEPPQRAASPLRFVLS